MAAQPFSDLLKTNTPGQLIDNVTELGVDWAEKDGAASILEETKKTLLNKIIQGIVASCTSKVPAFTQLESMALDDPRYQEHLTQMVEMRKQATKARVRYDMGKARLDMLRSQMATVRQEMSMTGVPRG